MPEDSRANPKFMLVEYPGMIQDVNMAFERLKFKDDGLVEFRFDPQDPWRPPIIGQRVSSTPRLLLRVPRGSTNLSQGEIIGRVDETCQFRSISPHPLVLPVNQSSPIGMADFRLVKRGPDLPLSSLSELNLNSIDAIHTELSATVNENDRETCYPPPRFTSSFFPYSPPSTVGGRTRKGVWSCSFNDTQIPQSPPTVLLNRVRRLHRNEFDQVGKLFAERPIWLRSALRHHLPDIGINELRMYNIAFLNVLRLYRIMPAIAYFFMDGPWRCCWVRYGYDPRRNPAARVYQELEIRATGIQTMVEMFPPALRKAAAGHSKQYVFDGININENINQFQYYDLTFPPLQSIITDPQNFLDTCDRREGWYIEGTTAKLRQIIKDRWFELVRLKDPAFYDSAILPQSMNDAPERPTDATDHQSQVQEEFALDVDERDCIPIRNSPEQDSFPHLNRLLFMIQRMSQTGVTSLMEPRSIVQSLTSKFHATSDVAAIQRIDTAYQRLQESRVQKLATSRDTLHQWMKKVEAAKWEAQRPADRSEAVHAERMAQVERDRYTLAKSVNELELTVQKEEASRSHFKEKLEWTRHRNLQVAQNESIMSETKLRSLVYKELGVSWALDELLQQCQLEKIDDWKGALVKCRVLCRKSNDVYTLAFVPGSNTFEDARQIWHSLDN